ncbi:hypothetical protein HY251_00615, partial [bacterium]|nr:hypothetical protein [bacterium]
MFVVDCPCGRDIQVRPEALGRRVRCTGCGGSVVLLVDESTGETVAQFSGAQPLPQRAAPPSAAAPAAEEPPRGKEALLSHDSDDPVWNRRYWFLAAALIPLFFSFF